MPVETTPDWATEKEAPDWAKTPDWALQSPRKPLLNQSGESSTTYGGPPLQLQTFHPIEQGKEILESASTPSIPLPRLTINPSDNPILATGKAAANVLIGLPEFAESPLGAVSIVTGAAAPRLVAGAFSAQSLYGLGKQVQDVHKNFMSYTPAQQSEAIVNMLGSFEIALGTGGLALKSKVPEELKVTAPATAEVLKTTLEKGEQNAIQKRSTTPVPMEVSPGSGKAMGEGTPRTEEPAIPQTPEKIVAAAYIDKQGVIHKGANHPEILASLGIKGFETRESRNTPSFGFITDKGNFVTRGMAKPIAEASGQKLETFDAGDTQPHADQIESPVEPGKPISETSPPPATTPQPKPAQIEAESKLTAPNKEAGSELNKPPVVKQEASPSQMPPEGVLETSAIPTEKSPVIVKGAAKEGKEQVGRTPKSDFVSTAANEATKATEAWGKHVVEVVDPLKEKIKKIQSEVFEMTTDANRTKPETKGKNKLTIKALLAKYGVSSKEELNNIYKAKNAEWADLEKQLEAAEEKRKELAAIKDRRGQEWSRAVAKYKEMSDESTPSVSKVEEQGKKPAEQLYKIGSNPTPHTIVERLEASEVEKANGEQPVRVKNARTGEESVVMENQLKPVKTSTTPKSAKQSVESKLKELGYSDTQIAAMPKDGRKALADRGEKVQTPISRGPGAAAFGEPGSYSPIQQMADRLQAESKSGQPIDQQISAIQKSKEVLSNVKDATVKGMANLVAVKDAMWRKWTSLPEFGDEQRAVGKWFRALQQADSEARNFGKQITKAVPSKIRREAITNWIQAEGNTALLKERAEASTGSIKLGYEAAQNLTPHEIEIAQMLRDYYDQQLQNGIDAEILSSGLDNYITQVWKKENPITKKLVSDLAYGKLTPNFRYARKRIFDSYFEGEQAGYIPNKDAGFLVANYDQSFNKSLAARAFIKDLHEGKASDGRPLVEISGNGKMIGEDDAKQSILVNPHAKPEELSDYRTIDHPALRGWKWATVTPEGKNVFVKGDMMVHPEAYQKLKNRLSVSAFRQNPVSRALLNVQTGIKQTMLSVSGFHQVQETLHALGHRVNPTNLPQIDFSEPVTRALAEHGLQLADYNALESFSEGLSGGGLMTKVPLVGNKLHAYNEWLFQDYIPRLKLQMAKLTLERNRERYPEQSEDKLMELSAREANAAFGELPYRYWGRSPTLQDALRTFILAPDFLEARARFVGRALRPFGREQLVALGILAATQYITARIINQILDKDPHFEEANAFRIVVGNHAYGLRTIPSDMIHLFTDYRGFFYNRMSPMLRTSVTAITGRDDRGVKQDMMEQVKDFAAMPIPISMRHKQGQKLWESFGNSLGIMNQRWDAVQTLQQKVQEFKKANGIIDPYETIYNREKDKYAALTYAIRSGDQKQAQVQFDKLASEIPVSKIQKHFRDSLARPFTGSTANDRKFYDSLSAQGKQEFEEAKDLRRAWLAMVYSLSAKGTNSTPADIDAMLENARQE